jgi:hypothetical protein
VTGDAVLNVGDRVGGSEVVLKAGLVEFGNWRRVRWMWGCVGADASALLREIAERVMRSDGVFMVVG